MLQNTALEGLVQSEGVWMEVHKTGSLVADEADLGSLYARRARGPRDGATQLVRGLTPVLIRID